MFSVEEVLDLKRNTATSFAPTNNNKFSYLVPRLPFLPLQLHPSPHPCFRIYCVLICFFSNCSFRSEQETKSTEKDMEMERYDITKERHLLCLNKSYHSF